MFKAVHTNNGYYCRAKNIGSKKRVLMMKFDTGAVSTVISIEALTKMEIDKERFIRKIEGRAEKRIFRSASGYKMKGYLVHADDVIMVDTKISRLYYYLIVDVNDDVCLLGDDFISKCVFRHNKDGDIEIKDMDTDGYVKGMEESL